MLNINSDELGAFVWNFNTGDNIRYNFEVVAALYEARDKASDPHLLNKPITIVLVSIIEAVLVDFLARIDQGTNHLPSNISREKIEGFKAEIQKKKIRNKRARRDTGDEIYLKRKKYNFAELITLFQKYEVFADESHPIYALLQHHRAPKLGAPIFSSPTSGSISAQSTLKRLHQAPRIRAQRRYHSCP